MAPRTSLACILTGPSRSAPDSDFIFLLDSRVTSVALLTYKRGGT